MAVGLNKLIDPDHLKRLERYLETGEYEARKPPAPDLANTYYLLHKTVGGLLHEGSLFFRLENLRTSAWAYIFGHDLGFDEEQQAIYQEIIRLMKEDGWERGKYRFMDETESRRCADLWLALLLSGAKRLQASGA